MSELIAKKRRCFWWFPIRLSSYEIVKNREDYELVIKSGLISRTEEKVKIFKINDISYSRTFWNFIFGVGSVRIYSSDASNSEFSLTKIHGYKEFGKQIDDLAYEERKRNDIKYTETTIR